MAAKEQRIGFGALAVCWGLVAGAFVLRALLTAADTPLILDTDDAMRLTVVHDLLAGQGWFDNIQHRLNTPYGGELHWSRLVDLPQAALLALLRPLFGPLADTALAFIWPLALLAGLLWLTARLALRLGGRRAVLPALLLPAFSLITMAEFAPGRLDHHSVQILLTLVLFAASLAALRRPRFALVAGVTAALMLAIGIEGLPMVLAGIVVFGLAWVAEPGHAVSLRDFGLSFGLGTTLALAIGVAPAHWLVPMTDAISCIYALAALLTGLAFLLLSRLSLRRFSSRLGAGVAAGAVVAALVVLADPGMLRGPYGLLDPWLLANWIDRISEAESWGRSLLGEPVYPLAVLVPCLTGLAVIAWHVGRRPADRAAWLVYGGFLLAAVFVMLLQIRGARIAVPLAMPASAVLVGAAWRRMATSRGVGRVFALLGAATASAGIVVALLATLVVVALPDYAEATRDGARGSRQACVMPSAFADLARLPPKRIMTPIDLGSHMLLYTPHTVVAAPYHRNQAGVLDAFRFFNGPLDEGRAILEARGVGLVAICPAMREIRGLVEHTPDSFVALFAENRLPDWLVEQTLSGSPLRVYAVR